MGKWLYEAMSKSYLKFFKPSGLLGAGGWPGAANNYYKQFWHSRFRVEVPLALQEALFPQLELLQKVQCQITPSEHPLNALYVEQVRKDAMVVMIAESPVRDDAMHIHRAYL